MGTPAPENLSPTRKRVIRELVDGRDHANQLKNLLQKPLMDQGSSSSSSFLPAEELVSKILRSFTETLSALSSSESDEVNQNLVTSHGDSHCDDRRSEDSGESRKRPATKDRRGCYKRRKTSQTWTIVSPKTDDGHAWRKYGQKEILNAKHPRSYFRCTRKYDQGCRATKQVQRTEDDLEMFQITYIGNHTCRDLLKAPQIITDQSDHHWESYLLVNSQDPSGKQDQYPLGSSAIKQESKEEALSDLTDNLNLWSDLKGFDEPAAIMSPKMGSDDGDVVSTMYSCTDTHSHNLDMDYYVAKSVNFDEDFNFDEIE